MAADKTTSRKDDVVLLRNPDSGGRVILVCEHAANFIPSVMGSLGLSNLERESHIAWDPGAMAVAEHMSGLLEAPLIASRVSRLVYDCNRPPDARDAMPARSEIIEIPGNRDLTPPQKAARVACYYEPFRSALAQLVARTVEPVLVTIHSYTPVYHGQTRAVEIGVLHDADARLADVLLGIADEHVGLNVQRNQPYGPENGVTHTLKEHALPTGHLNVMLEIRNDLIASEDQQTKIAAMITGWLKAALMQMGQEASSTC